MDSELPKGFRRIVSQKTGKVTFEVVAGKVGGEKVRKQFGEHRYGSQSAALAVASSWYAEQREKIKTSCGVVSKFDELGVLAITQALSEHTKELEKAIKLSEQRMFESFELLLKRQSQERQALLAKVAWLFSLSVEYGKNPIELLEGFLNDGLKGVGNG